MAAVPVAALAHASAPPPTPNAVSAKPVSVIASDEALGRPGDRPSRSDPPSTVPDPTTTVPPTPSTAARVPSKPTLYKAAPRATTAPTVRRAPSTTRQVPRTTTAAPKAKPTSTSAPSAAPTGSTQSGGATWYDAAPPGTCAHRTLPKGTVVHITDVANGATATCTVQDRGPYVDGMIIDLAKDVFSRMAPLSSGVIQVRISW